MAQVSCVAGRIRNTLRHYRNQDITQPQVDFEWLQQGPEEGLRQLDDGLIWLLGGVQLNPHPHLTSRSSFEISRRALNSFMLISRKMPIHTRVTCSITEALCCSGRFGRGGRRVNRTEAQPLIFDYQHREHIDTSLRSGHNIWSLRTIIIADLVVLMPTRLCKATCDRLFFPLQVVRNEQLR